MGIKFLTSQMLPLCFYMTGSPCHHSPDDDDCPSAAPAAKNTASSSPSASTIRLITPDGRVRTYRRPIKAAELTAEFPKHLVCRSDAFCIGQKVPALPENEQLQLGHSYFLLPIQFFQSVLSFVTVASSFARAAAATGADKATLMKAFHVHKTPSGALQIRVSDEFIEKIRAKEDGEEDDAEEGSSSQRSRVCTTAALEKDYRQLVRCRDQLWKPKLETISESRKKRMEPFSSFKRRKNKESQQQNNKVPTPPPPPPPPPRPPVVTTKLVKTKEPFSSFKRRKSKETQLSTPTPPPPPPPLPPTMTTRLVKTKGKQKLRNGTEC